jgi:hypothetical protein
MVILEHIGDLQRFVIDRVELAHELERCLVLEVLPLPLHLLMRSSKQLDRLPAAIAALLAPRHFALGCFEAALRLAVTPGGVNHRAIGKRGERL